VVLEASDEPIEQVVEAVGALCGLECEQRADDVKRRAGMLLVE
jgi:hypothetical protein